MKCAWMALIGLLLGFSVVWAQPVRRQPLAEAPPAAPLPTAPGMPRMPGMPGAMQAQVPAAQQPYPTWMTQQLPDAALQYLAERPGLLVALSFASVVPKPLTFLALFLLVGAIFSGIAHRGLRPPPGDPYSGHGHPRLDPRTQRHLAAWSAAAWLLALGVASEAVGMDWPLQMAQALLPLLATLVGWLVILGVVLAAAGSPRARPVMLAVLGWAIIQGRLMASGGHCEFDLGDGKRGRVVKVELMQSTFDLGGGTQETLPNSRVAARFLSGQDAPAAPGGG